MSSFAKNIKFTPIRRNNRESNSSNMFYSPSTNKNNNYKFNYSDNFSNSNSVMRNEQNFNNYFNNYSINSKNNYYPRKSQNSSYSNFNVYQFNENNIKTSNCYILISGFDNYTRDILNNFLEQQLIGTHDIKTIGNDKMLVKFQGENHRNNFIDKYQTNKEQFLGVVIQYLDENDYNRLINDSVVRSNNNISYNNYTNNNEIMQLPRPKSNLQKFLDVLLNL